MEKTFSTQWKASTQRRKQRKYRFNAPLHIKQKFMHSHLSKTLRIKYGKRAVGLKKGDKVTVLRGQYKKKGGKVERINLKKGLVYITGIEILKKDGTKVQIGITPDKLIIEELNLDDKIRSQALDAKKPSSKPATQNKRK